MRWCGRVKRMDESKIVKKVSERELIVRRVDRTRKRWRESEREVLGYKSVVVEQAEKIVCDRSAWGKGFVKRACLGYFARG